MNIKYHKGDLFNMLPDHHGVVIPHVCNNMGGWGRGFVVALSKRWPDGLSPEHNYRHWYASRGVKAASHAANGTIPFELGQVQFCKTTDTNITVANMIAQNGTVSDHNLKPIRYAALVSCMQQVSDHCHCQEIHAPKFGSALAGGNWELIEELIEELWCGRGLSVHVYEL